MRTIILVLLTVALAIAQPATPEQQKLVRALDECYYIFDWDRAFREVKADPALSKATAYAIVQGDPPSSHIFYANFIGRALQDNELLLHLAHHQMFKQDEDWKNSPLDPNPDPTRVSPEQAAENIRQRLPRARELFLWGNFQKAERIVAELDADLVDLGWHGHLSQELMDRRSELNAFQLACQMERENVYFPVEAWPVMRDDRQKLSLGTMQMFFARTPEGLKEAAGRTEPVRQRLNGREAELSKFLQFTAEWRFRQDAEGDTPELEKARQQALRQLASMKLEGDLLPGYTSWCASAAAWWTKGQGKLPEQPEFRQALARALLREAENQPAERARELAEEAHRLSQGPRPADLELAQGYPISNEGRYQSLLFQLTGEPAHYEKALAAFQEADRHKEWDFETCVLWISAAEKGLPDPKRAEHLDRAWMATLGSARRDVVVRMYLQRGLQYERDKNPEDALDDYSDAVNEIESYLEQLNAREAAATRLRERFRAVYEAKARLQLSTGDQQGAFETLARLGQAESVARLRAQPITPSDPEVREALKRTEEGRVKMVEAAAQSRGEASKYDLLAKTRAEYLQCLHQLEKTDPDYGRLSIRPLNFARLQASLPEHTVLVQLFPSRETLYLFVVTRKDLKVRSVAVSNETLEADIALLRRGLNAPHGDVQEVEGRLSEWMIGPLKDDVAAGDTLVFVPTDQLCYVPFACLREGDRYLVEGHPVVTLASAGELDVLSRPAEAPDKRFVALGNPDGTLPAAESEVRELARIFPEAQVFVGKDATGERVLSLDGQALGCLHLATHGVLNASNPLQSYLVVAGGKLSMADVAGLRLDKVAAVTLSACQTALADRDLGVGQDLYSLSEGFGLAGVRSVVGTLWKVDDGATRKLMLEFYGQLRAGKGRAEALRQAQLALLKEASTAEPFYWAPFVLVGDWR